MPRNKTNVRLPHRLSGHGAMSGEVIEFFPNGEDVLQIDDGEGHQRTGGAKRRKRGGFSAKPS